MTVAVSALLQQLFEKVLRRVPECDIKHVQCAQLHKVKVVIAVERYLGVVGRVAFAQQLVVVLLTHVVRVQFGLDSALHLNVSVRLHIVFCLLSSLTVCLCVLQVPCCALVFVFLLVVALPVS